MPKNKEIRNVTIKQSILFHPKDIVSDLHMQKIKAVCWREKMLLAGFGPG